MYSSYYYRAHVLQAPHIVVDVVNVSVVGVVSVVENDVNVVVEVRTMSAED